MSVTGRQGTGRVVWCCGEGEGRGVTRALHSLKVRRATSMLVTGGVKTSDAYEPAQWEDNLVITWLVQSIQSMSRRWLEVYLPQQALMRWARNTRARWRLSSYEQGCA
jgi:hypothetical protein